MLPWRLWPWGRAGTGGDLGLSAESDWGNGSARRRCGRRGGWADTESDETLVALEDEDDMWDEPVEEAE